MARRTPRGGTVTVPVQVTVRGPVPLRMKQYAEEKVAAACSRAHGSVLNAHVVLEMAEDPARERPALAEANLDVDGTQVRAKAVAAYMNEAVDLLEHRLRRNLSQNADRQRTRHRWIGVATEHEWRHGDLPTHRGPSFPRTPEERQVVRRKTFALRPLSVDEAAFEMDILGHAFYLFTDADSGNDAVIYRNGDDRYVVQGDVELEERLVGLVDLDGPAPVLTDEEAKARLDLAGEGFVFYIDADSGRGRVLYVRYDGHYGRITVA